MLKGLGINVTASVLSGWPKLRITEAPIYVIVLRGLLHFGTFIGLIGVSCYFYVLILRKRGQLGQSTVFPMQVVDQKVEEADTEGKINDERNFNNISVESESYDEIFTHQEFTGDFF